MTKFLNQINEQNLEIVCILIAVVAILLAIIVILDTLAKRKKEKQIIDTKTKEIANTQEQSESYITVAAEPNTSELTTSEEKFSKTTPIEEIKYVEENSEEEKTKAKIELQNLKESLMKIENNEPVRTEENINVSNKTNNNEEVATFDNNEQSLNTTIKSSNNEEKRQELDLFDINEQKYMDEEKNAIISIDELRKASLNAYTDEEMYKYEDEGNEPISIQELEALHNTIKMKPIEETPLIVKKEEPRKNYYEKDNNTFQTTPDISPIYGIKKTEESISLEQTANYDKLNEEIKKTTEFLATLKELRKNLE